MIAFAFEQATSAQAAVLQRQLGNAALSLEEIQELRQILIDTGALSATEALIAAGTSDALDALSQAPINEEGRTALITLVDAATRRVN